MVKQYQVTVKAVYMEEVWVLADDEEEAEQIARAEFLPEPDLLFSIDIYGLSPWDPKDQLEDIKHEEYRQREVDL
jgi:hypothetical protein